MLGVPRLAQMSDDVVGLEVDEHPREEDDASCYEDRVGEPIHGIHPGRSLRIKPSSYQISIQSIEYHTHKHYCNRHRTLASHQEGEDE